MVQKKNEVGPDLLYYTIFLLYREGQNTNEKEGQGKVWMSWYIYVSTPSLST